MHQTYLRFAVMLQNNTLKRWQLDVIETLINSGKALPVLLIYNDGILNDTCEKRFQKPPLFWRFYDKTMLRKGPLMNINLPEQLLSIPSIKCKVLKKGKYSEYFQDDDIQRIRNVRPDFILRFGFSIIRGEILNIAPYGIWSFHHSDEQVIRGGPAGFWEVMLGHTVQGVILQRLTNYLDGGIILQKRFYKTHLHDCAYTLHHVLNASASMALQVCNDILDGRATYFANAPSLSEAKIFSWPNNFTMLRFAFKQLYRRFHFHLDHLFRHEQWAIAVVQNDFQSLLANGKPENHAWVYRYKSLCRYPADPFALPTSDGLLIFFEHFSYKEGKAGLSTILFDNNFIFRNEKVLTNNVVHRSFPFLFMHDDTVYVLPEEIASGSVNLYQWDEREHRLIFVKTLLQKPLADAVLLKHQGTWFLFGSEVGVDINNCLSLYYSDELTGEYVRHPQQYLVFDPRGARMAGGFYQNNGILYRFGQDSSIYYGKRIAVFQVVNLSKNNYEEQFVQYIEPHWNKFLHKGIHTLQIVPPNVLFDGKRYVFSLHAFMLRLKQKIKKS